MKPDHWATRPFCDETFSRSQACAGGIAISNTIEISSTGGGSSKDHKNKHLFPAARQFITLPRQFIALLDRAAHRS
jgi:hypothetical protein